jgi:hypothetical protein
MAASPGAGPPPVGPADGVARSSPRRRRTASWRSEGHPIVQELDVRELDPDVLDTEVLDVAVGDTSDEGVPSGRHRAPASAARRTSVRLGLAALGVLVATGLGAVTADLVGLRDSGGSSPGLPLPRVAQQRDGRPGPGRTTDLTAVPAPPSAESDVLPAAPSAELQPEAAPAGDTWAPTADAGSPSAASVVMVRKGDSCPAVGQTGVTARGEAAVCTASPGKGPSKWRVA